MSIKKIYLSFNKPPVNKNSLYEYPDYMDKCG